MPGIEEQLYSISRLDNLSLADTPVHRADPRVKIALTLAFVVCVTSYSRYAVTQLLPFAAFPILLAAAADLPAGFLFRRLLVVSPFAVAVGIFNPLFDRETLVTLGGLSIPGGWISFASILIRFALCMSAALLLIATTGFYRICTSLQSLKIPSVLTVQLLLLYRYLFLLAEEALRLIHARELRSFGRKAKGVKSTGAIIASLLGRTLQRARRIHEAMSARGLHFTLPQYEKLRISAKDMLLLVGTLSAFVLLRIFDLSDIVGMLVTGGAG
jgi:cobalt/nickel transport system permease protein